MTGIYAFLDTATLREVEERVVGRQVAWGIPGISGGIGTVWGVEQLYEDSWVAKITGESDHVPFDEIFGEVTQP